MYRVKTVTLRPSYGEILVTKCENDAARARSHQPPQHTKVKHTNKGCRVTTFTL